MAAYDRESTGSSTEKARSQALRRPPRAGVHPLLALQQSVGNTAVSKLLAAPVPVVQRTHHTPEAQKGDTRKGAIDSLESYPRGTYGYSLSGVYRNFDRTFPTSVAGDGSGLKSAVENSKDFLSKKVASDPQERRSDCDSWAKVEAAAFDKSSDARTKEFGGSLPVDSRSGLMYGWTSAGQYVPDWMKRKPKESS